MHRCLGVLEILSGIAYHLTKEEAFLFALTCKTFLEPGLDEVWRHIDSFEPLIRCLPEDLWGEQRMAVPFGQPDEEYTLLHLRHDLTPEDMERYLDFYAHRIRTFQFKASSETRTLSIESLYGVQLATGCRPGALSPFLKGFGWYELVEAMLTYGREYVTQLAAHMSLFLGSGVEGLRIFVDPDDPLSYQAAVHAGIDRCEAALSQLYIRGSQVIDSTFRSFSLQGLEMLVLRFTSPAILRYLAVLPRLRELRIECLDDDNPTSLAMPSVAGRNTLPSLRLLEVTETKLHYFPHFLQYLPPNHGVQSLTWDVSWERGSVADWRSFLETLQAHSKCFSLRHLNLECSRYRLPTGRRFRLQTDGPEPIEMDPRQIDLEPLFTFGSLQSLCIELEHSVLLTPSVVAKIPSAWPDLRTLFLAPLTPNAHPPAIGHTHIVALSQKLPGLRNLGVVFDASCVTGEERFTGLPPQLRLLGAGRSPICSPSGVAAFVQHNFPELRVLHTWCGGEQDDEDMSKKRWEAVSEKWKETRRRVEQQ